MENSKLLNLLRAFSVKERNDFDIFLTQSHYNNKPLLLQLNQLLSRHLLNAENTLPDKKQLHKTLFPRKRYDDKRVRYLMTDLTKLAEQFIITLSINKNEMLKNQILLNAFRERKLEKEFLGLHRQANESSETATVRDADYYQYRFNVENSFFEFSSLQKDRSQNSKINEVMHHLDIFYMAQKLKLACEIINQSNVLSQPYDVFMLNELLVQLNKHNYSHTPAISVYHHILLTLVDPDKEHHFKALQANLISQQQYFSKKELRDIYQYLLNYCIRKINLGNLHYQQKLFETYQSIIRQRALLVNNDLSPWDYKNIITISLRLSEFNWAKNFISDYKKYLPAAERENAFHYNLANLHFRQSRFEETLKLLQKVDYTDVYYKLDSRSMLLKTYYELDYTDLFFYHATAFRTMLRRDRTISEYQRTIYLNLVKFTSKLLRNRNRKTKIEALKKQVEATPQVADAQWLKQKLEEH